MGKEKPVSFVRIGIVYTLSNIIIKGMSFLTNGIKLGLKQALEMHKLKVVQECEW